MSLLRSTAIDAINTDPIIMAIGQMQIAPWVLRSTATKAINSDPIKMEIGQMPVPLQPRLSTQIPSKWRLVRCRCCVLAIEIRSRATNVSWPLAEKSLMRARNEQKYYEYFIRLLCHWYSDGKSSSLYRTKRWNINLTTLHLLNFSIYRIYAFRSPFGPHFCC